MSRMPVEMVIQLPIKVVTECFPFGTLGNSISEVGVVSVWGWVTESLLCLESVRPTLGSVRYVVVSLKRASARFYVKTQPREANLRQNYQA